MVTATMMLILVSSAAQQGKNAVMDSGNHPQASPSFLDATQFTGSPDACLQIQHAFGGWPTFTFFVKVGTHAAGVGVFSLASAH